VFGMPSFDPSIFKKNVIAGRVKACGACHLASEEPGRVGLKTAYHKACFKCHKTDVGSGVKNLKGCTEMCHVLNTKKKPKRNNERNTTSPVRSADRSGCPPWIDWPGNGTRFCAPTVRWSRGSTRRGGRERSNVSRKLPIRFLVEYAVSLPDNAGRLARLVVPFRCFVSSN